MRARFQVTMLRQLTFLFFCLQLICCCSSSGISRFSFGNKNYVQLDEHMTWKEGQESCNKLGGVAVAINDNEENYKLAQSVVKGEWL